jgi:hypothetical protein
MVILAWMSGPGAKFGPGSHSLDGAGLVEQRFRARESRKYVDTQLLGLLAENGHQLSQRDDEVTVIGHLRRGGQAIALAARHEQELIAFGRHADRRRAASPVGEQLIERAGFKHRAGQGMRPQTGGLFQYADVQVGVELLQTNRAGEAGRAGSNDCNLVFHDIAGGITLQLAPDRGLTDKRARRRRGSKNAR